jgi:hypothetical protein
MKPTSRASLMSDAKWRKLFHVVTEHSQTIARATWKLLRESQPEEGWLPCRHDIWDSAVDNCLAGGPVDYSSIEWIEFPRDVSFRRYANAPLTPLFQPVDVLEAALRAIGEFPLERTEHGLRIHGYRESDRPLGRP